jgi:uncharacterized membrane protein
MSVTDLLIIIGVFLFLYGTMQKREKEASDSRLRNSERLRKANRPAAETAPSPVDSGYVQCLYCNKPIEATATKCPHCQTKENAGLIRMITLIYTLCYIAVIHKTPMLWTLYGYWIIVAYFVSVTVVVLLISRFSRKRK